MRNNAFLTITNEGRVRTYMSKQAYILQNNNRDRQCPFKERVKEKLRSLNINPIIAVDGNFRDCQFMLKLLMTEVTVGVDGLIT